MKVLLAVLLAYGAFFHLLHREDIAVGENLFAFFCLVGWIFFGVFLCNCVFGTHLGDATVLAIWLGLFGAWSVAGIWFLVGEYKKRWAQQNWWRSLRDGSLLSHLRNMRL